MKPSKDPQYLKLLGQFGKANYDMGSNENKGKPQAGDVTLVEKARNALLEYADK